MRKWIAVTAAVSALVVMGALPAGAGKDGGFAPLHVRKLVVGPVPPDTQFVVTIDCGDDIIFTGVSNPVSSVQLVFDAQGNPVGTGDTVMFVDGGNCTVTETQNGGAVSVIYECEGTFGPPPPTVQGSGRFGPRLVGVQSSPCETSGPQSEPISVLIEFEQQEATVTVTNTFVPAPTPPEAPAPAAAVAGAPRFTG